MTRAAAPKLTAYATLGGLGLLAALVTGRPELAALALPFLAVLAAALVLDADPELEAEVDVDRDRLLEGEELGVELRLTAARTAERAELLLALPATLTVIEGSNPTSVRVTPEGVTVRLRLRADRWGGYTIGHLHVRARDPFGLFVRTSELHAPTPIRVFPREEALRELLRPAETQLGSGDELSRRKGEGLEFADLRPFAFGDRVRRINWRASARRGELWVNEQHPERNADVVLFLDSFAEARRGGAGTLGPAVRAAAAIASRYVRRRDRVGLVSFGGVLRWLTPGMGATQLYRIVDALLDTEILLSYAWKSIDVVPPRTLPPQALVIAVTPLLDERSVNALLDLRARGFDVAVVEVSPLPYVEAGRGRLRELAYRLWKLRRDALRAEYLAAGVAVAEWREDEALAAALGEVTAFRRHAKLARV
ncbi:MAG TPA: DUF58 domain-containing protein [Gaiellaceae bacterium]|nr:DUF58 domain-containing protein [Gaiellaceae bacterium]